MTPTSATNHTTRSNSKSAPDTPAVTAPPLATPSDGLHFKNGAGNTYTGSAISKERSKEKHTAVQAVTSVRTFNSFGPLTAFFKGTDEDDENERTLEENLARELIGADDLDTVFLLSSASTDKGKAKEKEVTNSAPAAASDAGKQLARKLAGLPFTAVPIQGGSAISAVPWLPIHRPCSIDHGSRDSRHCTCPPPVITPTTPTVVQVDAPTMTTTSAPVTVQTVTPVATQTITGPAIAPTAATDCLARYHSSDHRHSQFYCQYSACLQKPTAPAAAQTPPPAPPVPPIAQAAPAPPVPPVPAVAVAPPMQQVATVPTNSSNTTTTFPAIAANPPSSAPVTRSAAHRAQAAMPPHHRARPPLTQSPCHTCLCTGPCSPTPNTTAAPPAPIAAAVPLAPTTALPVPSLPLPLPLSLPLLSLPLPLLSTAPTTATAIPSDFIERCKTTLSHYFGSPGPLIGPAEPVRKPTILAPPFHYLLSHLSVHHIQALVNQVVWSFPGISFVALPYPPPISRFLGTINGLLYSNTNGDAVAMATLVATTMATSTDAQAFLVHVHDSYPADVNPMVYFLSTILVYAVELSNPGGTTRIAWNVTAQPPTTKVQHQNTFISIFTATTFPTDFYYVGSVMDPPLSCGRCQSLGHPGGRCPIPMIPGIHIPTDPLTNTAASTAVTSNQGNQGCGRGKTGCTRGRGAGNRARSRGTPRGRGF
ncbi:hypothetical protein B0H13DRAFT_2478519 [Mycena leptocephala]|nr:hypothetical protein B0H13DRAFT_2478519 [Mycena leptocephala]